MADCLALAPLAHLVERRTFNPVGRVRVPHGAPFAKSEPWPPRDWGPRAFWPSVARSPRRPPAGRSIHSGDDCCSDPPRGCCDDNGSPYLHRWGVRWCQRHAATDWQRSAGWACPSVPDDRRAVHAGCSDRNGAECPRQNLWQTGGQTLRREWEVQLRTAAREVLSVSPCRSCAGRRQPMYLWRGGLARVRKIV
jgi:hypothetical protein